MSSEVHIVEFFFHEAQLGLLRLVTMYLVSRYGEQGSPMDSFPEATKACFSSLILYGVGRAGVEISPPGSFFFCLLFLVGGGDVKHSNARTSNPLPLANSFNT